MNSSPLAVMWCKSASLVGVLARCAVGKESIRVCLGLLFLGGLSLAGSVCKLLCRRHCSEDFRVSASDNDGKAKILIVRRIGARLW